MATFAWHEIEWPILIPSLGRGIIRADHLDTQSCGLLPDGVGLPSDTIEGMPYRALPPEDAGAKQSSSTVEVPSELRPRIRRSSVADVQTGDPCPGSPEADRPASDLAGSTISPIQPQTIVDEETGEIQTGSGSAREHSLRVVLLDETTINQIAAGEVVERPSSAVKELVENSLDAGATRIEVEIRQAGKGLIRISDNGIGMTPDEARLALHRHATSKIRQYDDLKAVLSLGFRGEALPSIASVSRMTISTGYVDGVRHEITVEGGSIVGETKRAGPKGTEIRVENLFYNTPARMKFMKSDATEVGQILDALMRYAVAYPWVAFTVWHNGQEALRTSGNGSMLDALGSVWNRDVARQLVPVDHTIGGLRVWGYVSPPHVTKPNRSYQYLTVNGRSVKARTLSIALDQAFRDLTPERRFAMVALDLEIDPERVDVNVSPTKSEVKFEHEGTAFEGLRYAIRQSLLDHGMMPSAFGIAQKSVGMGSGASVQSGLANAGRGPLGEGAPLEGDNGVRLVREVDRDDFSGAGGTGLLDRPQGSFGSVDGGLIGEIGSQASTGFYKEFSHESLGGVPGGEGGIGIPGSGVTGSGVTGSGGYGAGGPESSLVTERLLDIPKGGLDPFSVPRTSAMPYVHLLDDLRIIGQAQNTFILAETRHGIVVVDQHVAHERILYEYLCGLKRSTLVEKQPLLVPQTLEVDRRAAILLMEKIGELEQVGYELEPFGGDAFVVRAAPAALRGKDPIRVLRDLVDELIDSTVTKKLVPTREAIWIMSACKMAVKAGDPLSHAEMEKLLVDLATTENPYHCPHGRPITATLTTQELLKLFKRV